MALTMTATMMAQGTRQERNQRGQFDRTEMLKQRTTETAKELGLNEEQTAKLLELNTKYADRMRPQMRGQRMDRPERREMGNRGDSLTRNPQGQQRMRMTEEEMNNMRDAQKAYDSELKTILTEEQFNKYKEAEQRRLQQRGGQRGGQFGGQRGGQRGGERGNRLDRSQISMD